MNWSGVRLQRPSMTTREGEGREEGRGKHDTAAHDKVSCQRHGAETPILTFSLGLMRCGRRLSTQEKLPGRGRSDKLLKGRKKDRWWRGVKKLDAGKKH